MAIATAMEMAASVDCVELMVIDSVSETDPEETKYLQKKKQLIDGELKMSVHV
jgi:hypothetical protein